MAFGDSVRHHLLFLRFQIRQFHGGGDGDLLVIHHLLKLGGQSGEADIPLHLGFAFPGFIRDDLHTLFPAQLVTNLVTSSVRSCALPLDGLQLHFVRLGLFAGQNVLPLDIAVYH